jgi:hypothetical protein
MFCRLLVLPSSPAVTTIQANHQATKQYLFNSTDPTTVYLTSALSRINEIASRWATAQSDNTASSSEIEVGQSDCRLWKRVLIWMIQRIDESIFKGEESLKEEVTKEDIESITTFGGRFGELLQEVLSVDQCTSTACNAHSSSDIIAS